MMLCTADFEDLFGAMTQPVLTVPAAPFPTGPFVYCDPAGIAHATARMSMIATLATAWTILTSCNRALRC